MEWTKQHRIYERKAYIIINKHIKLMLSNINPNNVLFVNYEALITLSITDEKVKDMFKEIYNTIGLDYGNKVINSLEKITKRNPFFNEELLKKILLFLENEGGAKITSVKNTLIESLINEIKTGLNENATVLELRNLIQKLIEKSQTFYKWQSLRIARTETTSAANFAAVESAKSSDLVLQKRWISVVDDRTRHDHLNENLQLVEMDEKFVLSSGVTMLYPGDPKAPAREVINCRCAVSFVPKRDANGNLILKIN